MTTDIKTHTPGEWYASKTGPQGLVYTTPGGNIVAVTYSPSDADIVAATPDLLEALENAEFLLRKIAEQPQDLPQMLGSISNAAQVARDAIAKAGSEK